MNLLAQSTVSYLLSSCKTQQSWMRSGRDEHPTFLQPLCECSDSPLDWILPSRARCEPRNPIFLLNKLPSLFPLSVFATPAFTGWPGPGCLSWDDILQNFSFFIENHSQENHWIFSPWPAWSPKQLVEISSEMELIFKLNSHLWTSPAIGWQNIPQTAK